MHTFLNGGGLNPPTPPPSGYVRHCLVTSLLYHRKRHEVSNSLFPVVIYLCSLQSSPKHISSRQIIDVFSGLIITPSAREGKPASHWAAVCLFDGRLLSGAAALKRRLYGPCMSS